MARIRIKEGIAGLDFSWTPGDVVELPEEEAVRWADGYRAERADDAPENPERTRRETTIVPGTETPERPGGVETTTMPQAPRKAAAKKAAPRKTAARKATKAAAGKAPDQSGAW